MCKISGTNREFYGILQNGLFDSHYERGLIVPCALGALIFHPNEGLMCETSASSSL